MNEALFEIARFQLVVAALTPGPAERIADAYAYAWDVSVFPLFDDQDRLHRPFAKHFTVNGAMMGELMTFLDQRWSEGRVPSFYELETHYDVSGDGEWDRWSLIHALRYAFLSGRFDEGFYAALRKRGDHPAEAASIADPFDRSHELSLP